MRGKVWGVGRAPLRDLRVQPLALCGEHDAVDDLGRARVVRVRVVRVRVRVRVRVKVRVRVRVRVGVRASRQGRPQLRSGC